MPEKLSVAVTRPLPQAVRDRLRAHFDLWLEELAREPDEAALLPDSSEPGPPEPEEPDLYSLQAEITALRQENRRHFHRHQENSRALKETLKRWSAFLAQLEGGNCARKRKDDATGSERQLGLALAGFHDRLRRLLEQSRKAPATGVFRLWPRRRAAPAATKELARGLELLLAHLRELLTGLGMESIATVDHPFDPLTMQAISTVADPERADGLVTEKLKSGWLYRGDLLQPAEVIVNRRPAPAEAAGETATETG